MRTLLVDDHPLFADGLKGLLLARGADVVGTARDGWEALEQARALHPEVVLMDIQMPRCDGLTATRLIKAEMPEVKIVMLTMSNDGDTLFEAIKSGASGYLLKTSATTQFLELLSGLDQGFAPFSPGIATRILKEFSSQARQTEPTTCSPPKEDLSERQRQVLTLVAQGLTYKQVGEALAISERTVKYHMAEIIERLHVQSRAQALEYARQVGWGDKGE